MPSAQKRAEEILLGFERKVKAKGGGGGGGLRNFRPNALKSLVNAGNRKPEVMVKITNKSKNKSTSTTVKNHLTYIGRNGKNSIETKDERLLNSNKEVNKLTKEWLTKGVIEDATGKKQAMNLVLSMPKGTPPEAVKNAAREFAKELFQNHEWAMALHTDTDEPHVHLCVSMLDYSGKRQNPRKADIMQWRLLFAEKMQEQGVECTATRRYHRGKMQKAQNGVIEHIQKRDGTSTVNQAKLNALKQALKDNQRPLHPFLKEQLNTQQFILKEYKALAKQLYQEGHKTEAKAISQLAKQVEAAKPITTDQQVFDKAKTAGIYPKGYRLHIVLEDIKDHKGDRKAFVKEKATDLTPKECKTLSKQLYQAGYKTEAKILSSLAKDKENQLSVNLIY